MRASGCFMTGIRKEFVNRHIEKYLSDTGTDLDDFQWEQYHDWLESELLNAQAKAEAYDRLMSGEYTLKDMSNIFQMYSAIDADGYSRLFTDPPFIDRVGWSSNFPEEEFSIPGGVKHTGNWETSLTVPDEWEVV